MPALMREDALLSGKTGVSSAPDNFDIVCFSHLRWDFVFQRPQHLLSRAAGRGRVFYIEEPLFQEAGSPALRTRVVDGGVVVVQPMLPSAVHALADAATAIVAATEALVQQFVREQQLHNFVSWYYTPMALAFTSDLQPQAVVYDCMDELSAFRGAPPELLEREQELLDRADVVFTGGASLYESKRDRHANVHLFASSVDVSHFAKARESQPDPADQAPIAHPRVGFYGVLDERMDFALLAAVADLRPGVQFVLLGPLAKIGANDLPRRANLHYLGAKSYAELPTYLAGWDAAMLPFALNESTRYISPTKTPEYLAAHRQSVSTPIRDVVAPYGEQALVAIAATAREFADAVDAALQPASAEWTARVDEMLSTNSWDRTWAGMREKIVAVLAQSNAALQQTLAQK